MPLSVPLQSQVRVCLLRRASWQSLDLRSVGRGFWPWHALLSSLHSRRLSGRRSVRRPYGRRPAPRVHRGWKRVSPWRPPLPPYYRSQGDAGFSRDLSSW